ncbi:MAG: Ig-like domain-containing protein [Pseudonocardiaceae bacterium]
MRIGKCLQWLAARALVAAAALVTVVFLFGGAANATSPRSTVQATGVIAPAPTTTVLMTSPASTAVRDTVVTLTATVTPPAAGTVQFKDGANNLKVPVTVSNGKAEGTISQLTVGPHQLSAVFSPTDPAAFTTSISQVSFTVTAPAPVGPADTSTVLAAPSTSPIVQGSSATLIATVTPTVAAGTVQFRDGATNLGNPVTVNNGTASQTTLISDAGQRQLTAAFAPADPATFSPSISLPLSLTVILSPQTVSSRAQASGQSLDGSTVLDNPGVTVLDLGGLADGRGVTLLDGGTASDNRGGLTLLDLGGQNNRNGVTTLLDGRGLTVLRDRGSGGLVSNLLHALL